MSIPRPLELAGNTRGVSSPRGAPAMCNLCNTPFLELTERPRKRNLGNRSWDCVYILQTIQFDDSTPEHRIPNKGKLYKLFSDEFGNAALWARYFSTQNVDLTEMINYMIFSIRLRFLYHESRKLMRLIKLLVYSISTDIILVANGEKISLQ